MNIKIIGLGLAAIMLAPSFLASSALQAQSITISPGYTNLGVNQTLQYTAQVTGLNPATVTWGVNQIPGGNSTIGTITSNGLYTAPATVPTVSTLITALGSDKKTLGVMYVNIAPVGPSITSVSPSPIPIGSYTVTLTGTGFAQYAYVMEGGAQYGTTFVNSTTLKVSGYHGPAGAGTFQVENPGTLWGPSFNVTFVAPQTISPTSESVSLGASYQFTSAGATSWTATVGTVSSTGLYTAPATMPSSSKVTVTATGPGGSASATVTLKNPTPQTVSPTSVTLNLGATQQFTSVGATSWTAKFGTITSAGLYTAPSAYPTGGTDTVTVTGANGTATAAVKLNPPPQTISPTTVSVLLGATQQFTSAGATSWSATAGTVSSTGLFTAPATMPSSSTVTVSAAGPGGTASATVTLTNPNPQIIAPTTVSLNLGAAQQFTSASATSWSAKYGVVTSAGLYTAPPAWPGVAADTVTVTGTNGTATATVTLIAPAQTISPTSASVLLGGTQQFTSALATSWSATAGAVSSSGLYTAPATMPASNTVTVTATGPGGNASATVTLTSPATPMISAVGTNSQLPLGIFSSTVTGSNFTTQSVASLNGATLITTYGSSGSLTISGFAGQPGTASLTVTNGTVASAPFTVQVGVANPVVSYAAAKRFLEQAGFGATPADAANLQTIGFQAWLNQQFAMPVVSNYSALGGASQGGMPQIFLTNAVNNGDQLRQKVAWALSQIFVVSFQTVIWDGDMSVYQQMLLNDAFTSYPQILNDVTLSPAMGEYLNTANNARANPAIGTVANENYAREVMQLFSIGTVMLNQDGSVPTNASGPIPTYSQTDVTEMARVLTGWTYPAATGGPGNWGGYINSANGPMVPFMPEHDFGQKTLVGGYISAANLTPQQDLQGALTNLATHPNTAPFISQQLIQHLVKSNPSPAYVQRVAAAFTQSGGDMKTVISAILLDTEARANDQGGNDQPTDGHFQEPALFIPGFVRAFGGQMTTQNYFAYDMLNMGQDIYDAPSVFNYYSPSYVAPGAGGLLGPELQIDNSNAAIVRENVIANIFGQYSNPVATYGPGTTIDLTPLLPLAASPATLVNAIDFTLTHGVMPAAMKNVIVSAVSSDTQGSLHRVQTAIYLTVVSGYYNVWH